MSRIPTDPIVSRETRAEELDTASTENRILADLRRLKALLHHQLVVGQVHADNKLMMKERLEAAQVRENAVLRGRRIQLFGACFSGNNRIRWDARHGRFLFSFRPQV